MDNYFKIVQADKTETHHMFDDASIREIRVAFGAALVEVEPGSVVSLYRPIPVAGEWNLLPLIGHRSRDQIMADIKSHDGTERDFYFEELTHLEQVMGETCGAQSN